MLLLELYFGNLSRNGGGTPDKGSNFNRAAISSFGSYEAWKRDFINVGKMRGIGWVICYMDPRCFRMSNYWISSHEIGNIASFVPVLVMDVWEHAYLRDYLPAEKSRYIDAFFLNVDWQVVEDRLKNKLHTVKHENSLEGIV